MRKEAEQAEYERQEVIRKKREFEEQLEVEKERKRLERIKQGASKKRGRGRFDSSEEERAEAERRA